MLKNIKSTNEIIKLINNKNVYYYNNVDIIGEGTFA